VLGSILALAAVGTTLAQGVVFLLVYALGLGVPFLLVGLLIDRISPIVRRISRYTGPISIVGGALLVLTGMLILSSRLAQLANYAPLFNW
jgi:cytochrome c-type biogenesis protein